MEDEVTVLLIEDDAVAAEMYRSSLVADGYTVIVASDGESGLSIAQSESPDLIYLDLGMSSMQVDTWARGFSYTYDAPLDMRMTIA